MIYSSLWLIWLRPGKRTHALGVIKCFYLLDPSLYIISIYSVRLIYVQVKNVERNSFRKKYLKCIYYMTHMSTPSHNKPYPGCRTILNFGSPFHGNHFYILSLSYLHPGVENLSLKDINNAFLLHDIYLCPISRTPTTGSWNLHFFTY